MAWIRRYLSPDDLWSVIGYVLIVGMARVMNPAAELPAMSLIASGMLAIFWLASKNVRARNVDRSPNARVVFWGLVAVASALVLARG